MELLSSLRARFREARIARGFAARGPWCTKFDIDGRVYGGELHYKYDTRIQWVAREFPNARTILELGSLEGGQSFELARLPGVKVVSVEGRRSNLRKAKWVQKILGLRNVSFVNANVETVDLRQYGPFDLVFCSGLLYHLPRPWELIEKISHVSSNLFLATHYVEDARGTQLENGYSGLVCPEQTDALSGLSSESFHFTLGSLRRALNDFGFGKVTVLDDVSPPQQEIMVDGVARSILGSPYVILVARK